MKITALSILLVWLVSLPVGAQQTDSEEAKYEWRIRQEVLYGVYIPRDLNDALVQLHKLTDAASKAKFKAMSEDDAVHKLFFSLGRWMTHNWSLYEGSRLSVSLQQMGIHHPDDMVRVMIRLFHRSLNGKPLEIEALLKQVKEEEEKRKQERLKKGQILYQETRKVDPAKREGNGNDGRNPR
ncbi:MAG: hypothetical protein KatS3mg030_440 [Saprospiraceae bacterium]|nr:MAG: hypothetical protein KatS3mg030_440 [Saprospiraceae bacterium]